MAVSCPRVVGCCADKGCFEDLNVVFSADDQKLIDRAVSVRRAVCTVDRVDFDLAPALLRAGCWTVEANIYLTLTCDVHTEDSETPVLLRGTACCQKRTTLFGEEGGVKVFRSDGEGTNGAPDASIQIAEPIVLSVCLISCNDCCCGDPCPGDPVQTLLVTIGLYTITSLERPAQLRIPIHDFVIPRRSCPSADNGGACALFDSTDFPTDRFLPNRR